MRVLTSIVIVFLLLFISSCNNSRKGGLAGRKGKTLEMLRAEQDSLRVADSLRRIERRIQALEEARQDSIRMAAQENPAGRTGSKYNIIVGSFLTPDNALKRAEEYRNKGFDARVIVAEDNDYELVAAESYDQLAKAEERLSFIRNNIDKSAWLYVKK
jgi:hypothetical protein